MNEKEQTEKLVKVIEQWDIDTLKMMSEIRVIMKSICSLPEPSKLEEVPTPHPLSDRVTNAVSVACNPEVIMRTMGKLKAYDLIPQEMVTVEMPEGMDANTKLLVSAFATALANKLHAAEKKYGYNNTWFREGWQGDCQEEFSIHIEKGDPRDVAAYCAFMWYHGWETQWLK